MTAAPPTAGPKSAPPAPVGHLEPAPVPVAHVEEACAMDRFSRACRPEIRHPAGCKVMEWIPAPEARPAGDYVSASRKRIIAVVSGPILTLNRHSQSRKSRQPRHRHHD